VDSEPNAATTALPVPSVNCVDQPRRKLASCEWALPQLRLCTSVRRFVIACSGCPPWCQARQSGTRSNTRFPHDVLVPLVDRNEYGRGQKNQYRTRQSSSQCLRQKLLLRVFRNLHLPDPASWGRPKITPSGMTSTLLATGRDAHHPALPGGRHCVRLNLASGRYIVFDQAVNISAVIRLNFSPAGKCQQGS